MLKRTHRREGMHNNVVDIQRIPIIVRKRKRKKRINVNGAWVKTCVKCPVFQRKYTMVCTSAVQRDICILNIYSVEFLMSQMLAKGMPPTGADARQRLVTPVRN